MFLSWPSETDVFQKPPGVCLDRDLPPSVMIDDRATAIICRCRADGGRDRARRGDPPNRIGPDLTAAVRNCTASRGGPA
jgi:hypothetical protein